MDDTTTSHVTEAPATEPEPEIQAPLLLYAVFGLPVFLVVLYFFLQFTRPDRFGRVDRADVDKAPPGDAPAQEDEPRT
jgi:hypothetical protein